MRVTVCELPDDFDDDCWAGLVDHRQGHRTRLVVLPEMPFSPWPAATRDVDDARWAKSVEAHDGWIERLGELGADIVVGSKPITHTGRRLNEGFTWTDAGPRPAHRKYYLPDEPGFWEASWYQRDKLRFEPVALGDLTVGFMICTDMWFTEPARAYGRAGAQLVVTPRATPAQTTGKWLAGGRAAAVMAGAVGLSSNRCGPGWAGTGWVIDPDGDILATTSASEPAVTIDIAWSDSDEAKSTYPRYVPE